MKSKRELEQFLRLEAALTQLCKVTHGADAVVSYDEALDALTLKSELQSVTQSTAGSNARCAAYDFVCNTCGKLIF